MSRVASALVIAGVIVALQTPAYPCLNGTILEGDAAVRQLAQAEAALDAGNLSEAGRLLGIDHMLNDQISGRWYDAKTLLYLRINPQRSARHAIDHFATRSKQVPQSIRHRAWLAEAYAAGRKREDALRILAELRERDLMPDGFAWVTLAKLSNGADVDTYLETCKKRAKTKSICVIQTAETKPAKVKPANKMKL
jgi:hypothetical protein